MVTGGTANTSRAAPSLKNLFFLAGRGKFVWLVIFFSPGVCCADKTQVPGSHQDVKYQDPPTEGTCTLGQNVMPKCPNFVASAANFQGGQKAGDTRPQKLQRSGSGGSAGPGDRGTAQADAGDGWREDVEWSWHCRTGWLAECPRGMQRQSPVHRRQRRRLDAAH